MVHAKPHLILLPLLFIVSMHDKSNTDNNQTTKHHYHCRYTMDLFDQESYSFRLWVFIGFAAACYVGRTLVLRCVL